MRSMKNICRQTLLVRVLLHFKLKLAVFQSPVVKRKKSLQATELISITTVSDRGQSLSVRDKQL